VDRDARHSVAVAEVSDKRGGLPGQHSDARIAEQPGIAGYLDQHLLQARRETEAPILLSLAGNDGLRTVQIIIVIGGGSPAAECEHRCQARD
jgi:hypothetical protein